MEVPFEPQGARTIPIFVAKLSATGGAQETDPIVIVPGGPGQSASGSYVALHGAFAEANAKRDILIVDPRGTGRSHPFDCPAHPMKEYLTASLASDTPPLALVSECKTAMSDPPRAFHTEAFVRDLERVRQELGYARWNLYAVSYGTRVALTYARMAGSALRSIVLDGVVAQQTIVGDDNDRDADRALALVAQRCNGCTLIADLEKLHAALHATPRAVTFPHPRTAKPTTVTLTGAAIVELARFSLYMPEVLAPLPVLAKGNDLAPLAALLQLQRDGALSAVNPWINLAVLCREDVPFVTKKSGDGFFSAKSKDELVELCERFGVEKADRAFHAPVESSVPTLLLSGEADPVTPPANAELAAKTLAKSRHVVAKGQGHNVIGRGCLPHISARFFETADPATLDVKCADAITAFPLFSEATGP